LREFLVPFAVKSGKREMMSTKFAIRRIARAAASAGEGSQKDARLSQAVAAITAAAEDEPTKTISGGEWRTVSSEWQAASGVRQVANSVRQTTKQQNGKLHTRQAGQKKI